MGNLLVHGVYHGNNAGISDGHDHINDLIFTGLNFRKMMETGPFIFQIRRQQFGGPLNANLITELTTARHRDAIPLENESLSVLDANSNLSF